MSNAQQRGEINFRDMWDLLVRNRWLALSVVATVVGLTALYTYLQRPTYESTATLLIEQDKGNSGSLFGNPLASMPMPMSMSLGNGALATDLLLVSSRQITEAVVDSLSLHVELVAPAAPRSGIFRSIHAPRNARPATYVLSRQENGSYGVSLVTDDAERTLTGAVRPGQVSRVGDLTVQLAAERGDALPKQIRLKVLPFRKAVEETQSNLQAYRTDRDASIISIQHISTDPRLAAAVPNAVAASFIRYKRFGNAVESETTVRFLREQVAEYQDQLSAAETALREYRERATVVSLPDQASEQVKRLAALQARRDELDAERDALNQLLARASTGAAPGNPSPYRQLASFPVFFANQAVQNILQALTELETQRSELLVKRTTENVDVAGIDARIRDLELQLYQTARGYLQSLDSEAASLESTLARFDQQLQTIPAREIEFARRLRQQKLLEEMYTLLQSRLKEAEIRQASQPDNLQIVDAALVPTRPVSPQPVQNMIMGTILGLALAGAVVLGRKAMDNRVRTQEDATTLSGGLPVLAVIPRISMRDVVAKNGNGNGKGNGRVLTGPETLAAKKLVTRGNPRSPASEAFRSLRTSITFAGMDQATRVIMITSAAPGDGKSTSSFNLALTLAQQGTRTLLVDADLRRGNVHTAFGLPQAPGLTNVLYRASSLEEAVQSVESGSEGHPLSVLTAGIFPPDPSELLGSQRMRELMVQLRGSYDMIVIDAPPLNLVTDAAVLGTMSDSVLVVSRAGVTHRDALHSAVSQLRHLSVPVRGVILNDVETQRNSYYGSEPSRS